jgi:transcription termination factor 2
VVIPEQPVGSLDSISEEQSLPDDLTKVEKAIKQVQCAMKPNIMTQLPDKGQALKLKEAQLLSAQDALEKRSSPEIVAVEQQVASCDKNCITKLAEVLQREGPQQQSASINAKYKIKQAEVPQRIHPAYEAYMEQERRLYGGKMTDSRMVQVKAITKGAIQDLYHSLDSCPTAEETDPPGLIVPLMKHQREALAWLLWRETQRPSGGILADDMGLGKTLTMISLIMKDTETKLHHETDLLPTSGTLVVCPASVVMQWESEIQNRVEYGRLSVYVHHGQSRLKDPERLKHFDIVLTSYATLNSEGQNIIAEQQESGEQMRGRRKARKKTSHCVLPRVHWHRVILDEGHTIKNHKTSTAASACMLEASHRWILTGTPVQNDLLDMYSLIKFLRVAPFSELGVWKHHVSVESRAGSQRLHILVKSLLLQRTKKEIITTTMCALPEKQEQVHHLELSVLEAFAHWRLFSTARCFLATEVVKSEDTLSSGLSTANLADERFSQYDLANLPQELKEINKVVDEAVLYRVSQQVATEGRTQSSLLILTLILRLQQCCNHLSLLVSNMSSVGDTFDDVMGIVEKMDNLQLDSRLDQPNPSKLPECFLEKFVSTKIRCLVEEISQIAPSSKCVVVSQWTSMLNIVQVHLEKAGIRCDTIKGSMRPIERQRVVDSFNSDSRATEVLLLSLRAGGCGLNLIGGNHLFLLDPHWNPALEQQACDRIYRVGQKKNVVIHKFICQKSIEEKLILVQEKKKAIADRVLISGKPSTAANKLSIEDLKMLFDI